MESVPPNLRTHLGRSPWRRLDQRSALSRELSRDPSGTVSSLFSAGESAGELVPERAPESPSAPTEQYFYKFVHEGGAYACLLLSENMDAVWLVYMPRERVAARVECELPQFRMSAERICTIVSDALRSPEEQCASVSVAPLAFGAAVTAAGDGAGRGIRLSCPLALPGVAPVVVAWKLDLQPLKEFGDGTANREVVRQQVVAPLAAVAHGAAWVAQLLQQWAVAQARELKQYRDRFGALPGGRTADFDPTRFRDDVVRASELRGVMANASVDTRESSAWLSMLLRSYHGTADAVLPSAGPPPAAAVLPTGTPSPPRGEARPASPTVHTTSPPKRRRVETDGGAAVVAPGVAAGSAPPVPGLAAVRMNSNITGAELARRELLSQRLAAAAAAHPDSVSAVAKKIKKAFK
eukprot:TRINITY_DN4716_c0_g1_i1.p1 TRINITY_DN4716_c0_g1~~TRINITY_DN4716_c0_g1_i1.p1  ORF type:complete len:409 (+),score=73.16 TRINITY_DN4716_c0_g1_i1:92-1318(+)